MKRLLLVGVAFMAMLPMPILARGRIGVIVRPEFVPYSWYGWYGPYYGMYPYTYGPRIAAPNTGALKLDTDLKDAEVFINGSYAGTVGKLKTMRLRPGNYTVEIRAAGRTSFERKIYIVAGKTLKLHPDLQVEPAPAHADS